jgi:uncharacterized protein
MIKAVLDTNVIISAFISPNGTCAQIAEYLAAFRFVVCLNQELIDEINRAIRYGKIAKKRPYTEEEIEMFLLYLSNFGLLTDGKVKVEHVQEDPDDDVILACAVEAGVDFVVSGDDHLLSLGEFQNIPIVRPGDFLRILQSHKG